MACSKDTASKVARTHYDDIQFAIDSRYKVTKVLGKGTYGVVCLAYEANESSNRKVAIKKVMKIFTNEVLVKRAMRELKLMRHFRGHRNVCWIRCCFLFYIIFFAIIIIIVILTLN